MFDKLPDKLPSPKNQRQKEEKKKLTNQQFNLKYNIIKPTQTNKSETQKMERETEEVDKCGRVNNENCL